MRVLQFGRYYPPHVGGTENVMYDLTQGLNGMGISCDVLCCNDTNHYEETAVNGHTVYRTKTILKVGSIAISPQQIFTLRRIARNYDVIQVHHPSPMATLAMWLIRPSAKVVIYWHSDIVRQRVLLTFFKPFQNWLLKRADAIVATTPLYIKDSEALQKYPAKTTYIPIGISGLATDNPSLLESLRQKYSNRKVVFSLGRLVEYKGYKHLVDAARYLPSDYVVVIGGDGRLRPELEAQIREHGLTDKVELAGKLPDAALSSYFEVSDLFCLPSVSKNEAFGLVLAEAMSLSKPVVATTIPGSGVHWVNAHTETGVNVPVEDAQALAKGITDVVEDRSLYKKYSEGAFHRFTTLFKKDMMVSAFAALYNSLLTK